MHTHLYTHTYKHTSTRTHIPCTRHLAPYTAPYTPPGLLTVRPMSDDGPVPCCKHSHSVSLSPPLLCQPLLAPSPHPHCYYYCYNQSCSRSAIAILPYTLFLPLLCQSLPLKLTATASYQPYNCFFANRLSRGSFVSHCLRHKLQPQ